LASRARDGRTPSIPTTVCPPKRRESCAMPSGVCRKTRRGCASASRRTPLRFAPDGRCAERTLPCRTCRPPASAGSTSMSGSPPAGTGSRTAAR
jgi:hypothetical protein